MSIEINDMVVQAQISEENDKCSAANVADVPSDLEKMKLQIISQCKELFYELLNEQKER